MTVRLTYKTQAAFPLQANLLFSIFWLCSLLFQANTQRRNNVVATSLQRRDVAATL